MRWSTMDKDADTPGQQAKSPVEDVSSPSGDAQHLGHPGTTRPIVTKDAIGVILPRPCIEPARRYLNLLAGGDASHSFQPYNDQDPNSPESAWMRRVVHGHVDDVWPTLLVRQSKGAAIAVTMAETDGRGRKSPNMARPRAVWIEADAALLRALPITPTITVETSPGRRHYVYVARDLTWLLWHGVQQVLIADYGSDRRAALRTQVLRLPGTLHLKDPARPHLVHIVEDMTSERIYTAAEIAAAFPPRLATPPRRRCHSAVLIQLTSCGAEPPLEWEPEKILSAFIAVDARLQDRGPFIAKGDRPDDEAIVVDWSRRDWWLRAVACLHHASGGSDAGFKLSCAASGGVRSLGLVGCPAKFDAAEQRRVWDSLTAGPSAELRGIPVTIRTIYWIAQRYCGWRSGRRGRPIAQPRPAAEISEEAQAVAEAGRWAVSAGLERVVALHAAMADQRIANHSLVGRTLQEIRRALDATTGVAAIGSLTGMAGTLGCATETLRRYLRILADRGLIIKNDGNATSMLGTSGITVALGFPERVRETIRTPLIAAIADPPISEQTGIPIPYFHDIPGRIPSRSPYSHGDDPPSASPGQMTSLTGQAGDPLWGKADLTLGDWIQVGVIHAEFSDHLVRLADTHGKRAVARVLIRFGDLMALRSSFADLRCDAEYAADLAARSLVRKAAKANQLSEPDLQRLLDQASPAGVSPEESAPFVRQMARHLDAIIREAKGDPDPWRSARWRQRSARQAEPAKQNGNAYAAARMKRDPSAL